MKPTPIFNPDGTDSKESRQIWFGNTTNLMNLNNVKYEWALRLYKQMRENFWVPEKLDLTSDTTDYNNLTDDERRAYNGILSYLTFLDSIQTCNIPHLKSVITAPEISLCMAEQISQEAMHNHSYQYMIESIIPSDQRQVVYDFWRTDDVLRGRCHYIADKYQSYIDTHSDHSYRVAITANYILEGLYFYNGFVFFYNLASRNLMGGSADIFRMIHRDELSHVRLYQHLLKELIADADETFADQVRSMFSEAVDHEIGWSKHIIGEVLGVTHQSIEAYTHYLANTRLRAVGLEPIFTENIKNPYKHLERFADTGGEANTKSNFFEATVTSYQIANAVGGWNDI